MRQSYNGRAMSTKTFLQNGASNGLSNALTLERLKKSGVAATSASVSGDPDLEALRRVVRSSKSRAKQIGVSHHILKKLAGV
jgi:hypothetical protein